MSGKLADLERCLDPGLSRLNWNSLGIPEFVAAVTRSVHEFQSLMNQVGLQLNSADRLVMTLRACRVP